MRNTVRIILAIVLAAVFNACSDRLDDYYTAEDLAGLKINLQLPNYSKALVNTRALESGETIGESTVIAYDSDGKFISQQKVTPNGTTIAPSLPSGTATVAMVANYTGLTDNECSSLSTKYLSTLDASKPVCWGTATVSSLLQKDAKLSLVRMEAKVTVTKAEGISDFTIEGIKMCNTATQGSIAYTTDGKVMTPTGDASNVTTGDFTTSSVVFFETPSNKGPYLIIKGIYKNKEGFYKVKMYKDPSKNSDEYDLVRNHNYMVTINSVNEAGYASEELAAANDAENRMTVNIVDDNPVVVDMIACKDYELGVCDGQKTAATAGKVPITLVTTKSDKAYTVTSSADWITVPSSATETTTVTSTDGETKTTGTKVVLDLSVTANSNSQESRDGTVTVTSGDLTRTITITQAGYDFLGDDNRKVLFLIDGTQKSDDYFGTFLTNVSGRTAADNHGLDRDNGLHFAAVNPNTYSYKIPHLTGDNLTNSDSRISISDDGEGNYYTVTLKDNTNDALWVSSFTITNKDNVTITYPVYHTGVFQNLTATDQLGTAMTGWFYYGVVEVTGKSGNTYRMLDRNIGATNNGFYSPATQAMKENEGAKGAYMILTRDAITTTSSTKWYVYKAPSGVSSINFLLKSASGGNDSYKLTDDVKNVTKTVFYSVSGGKASTTDDRPSSYDSDGIYVYVKSSSVPYIYVWDNSQTALNGAWTSTNAMTEYTDPGSNYLKKDYMPFNSYFQIPTEDYADDLGAKVEMRTTADGETYYCYFITTTGGSNSTVQPAEVYIPVTGYYEGTSFRNENHANIWTMTRLSGYQGFSTSSPEFGFWFRYLDCHNSIKEISNIRIVSGSAGQYGGHIYTAMPVRGIHKK